MPDKSLTQFFGFVGIVALFGLIAMGKMLGGAAKDYLAHVWYLKVANGVVIPVTSNPEQSVQPVISPIDLMEIPRPPQHPKKRTRRQI